MSSQHPNQENVEPGLVRMLTWTHRCCERCWFSEPDLGMTETGYRLPVQLNEPDDSPGKCCLCGWIVVTQIYVRRKPSDLACYFDHYEPETL